jgi:hypothetical protein
MIQMAAILWHVSTRATGAQGLMLVLVKLVRVVPIVGFFSGEPRWAGAGGRADSGPHSCSRSWRSLGSLTP